MKPYTSKIKKTYSRTRKVQNTTNCDILIGDSNDSGAAQSQSSCKIGDNEIETERDKPTDDPGNTSNRVSSEKKTNNTDLFIIDKSIKSGLSTVVTTTLSNDDVNEAPSGDGVISDGSEDVDTDADGEAAKEKPPKKVPLASNKYVVTVSASFQYTNLYSTPS